MSYTCETLVRPAQPVMSVRTRTPVQDLPNLIGVTYGKIIEYLSGQGAAPSGAPFVAYYNMDMQDLDLEVGFPVAQHLPGSGSIQAGEMPAGEYAACLYTGPYEQLQVPYNALQEYTDGLGRTPTGVAYEIYLNAPDEVPPEQLQTHILFPLQA
jgi:effector-binding domain-containing protein